MYNPEKHHRRSIRMRGYDYANKGAYFITICLNQRIPKIWQPYGANIVGADLCVCPVEKYGRPVEKYGEMGQTDGAIGRTDGVMGQPRRAAPTGTDFGFDFPIFGMVENGVMVLNDCGKMVQQTWHEMREHYPGVEIGEFIVMPDHIHGIIIVGAAHRGCPVEKYCRPGEKYGCPCPGETISLPQMVYYLKTRTMNKYIDGVKTSNWQPFNKRLWQRNYWERVIRVEAEYERIAKYIRNNPILWRKKHLNRILPQNPA